MCSSFDTTLDGHRRRALTSPQSLQSGPQMDQDMLSRQFLDDRGAAVPAQRADQSSVIGYRSEDRLRPEKLHQHGVLAGEH
ncbi:MAG: hypothetical protein ACREXP_29010, partial [Steroidobacteraceae bacterium]